MLTTLTTLTTLTPITTRQAQAPGLSMRQLLGAAITLEAGSLFLGLATDGHPVVARLTPQLRPLLLTADHGSGLLALAQTAVATARHFDPQLGVAVVTEQPDAWAGIARPYVPAQLTELATRVRQWQPTAPTQRLLIVLDEFSSYWGMTPQTILDLNGQAGVHVIATARPSYAATIHQALGGWGHVPAVTLVIGHVGDQRTLQALTHPVPLTIPLGYGTFALRHKSAWMLFVTATTP